MNGLESLLAGRVLVDRYRIEAVIGRGGMGAVYRATDERLGRAVAVKVITVLGTAEGQALERIRARFRHEAASAARLPHHPNVVPVYDYGTDPTLGLDFIVMELLRGEDLSARLGRPERPSLALALDILVQAARGIAVGHRAGVIHRDVKPGNIFLVNPEDPEELQVRVLDFGIAKVVAEEDTFSHLTQDGRAPLSPAYASPEQLRGEARITPASDVFSLGAVAYQLLTGERAFTEADRNRMGIGLPVPVPSARARAPGLPAEVEEALQRALAHDPAERFPHAGAFAEALARIRASAPREPEPVLAPPPPPRVLDDDATHIAEDDRTLLAPVGVPAPAPMTAAAPLPPMRSAPAAAPAAESRSRRGFLWGVLLLGALAIGLFAWLGSGGDGPTEDPLAGLPDTAVVVDSTPEPVANDPMDPAMQNLEGKRYAGSGDYAAAYGYFARAVQLDPDNAEYRYNLGYTLLRLGRNEEAEGELRRSVGLDPQRVAAYRHIADAALVRGDTALAVAMLDEYLARSTYEAGRQQASRLRDQLRATPAPVEVVPEPDTTPAPQVATPAPAPPPARPAPRDTVRLTRPGPRDTIRLP